MSGVIFRAPVAKSQKHYSQVRGKNEQQNANNKERTYRPYTGQHSLIVSKEKVNDSHHSLFSYEINNLIICALVSDKLENSFKQLIASRKTIFAFNTVFNNNI